MVGALPRALRPGDEGHDDVGRVAIEVQSSPVIVRIPTDSVQLFRSIPYTGSDVFVHRGERLAGAGVR
jgi:hypothetical protein